MPVSLLRHLAPAGCAAYEAFLDEKRLVHFLQRSGILSDGCGYGCNAYGTSLELVDDGQENLVVYLVKPVAVNVERFEGITGDGRVDTPVSLYLSEVAHAAQQGPLFRPQPRR